MLTYDFKNRKNLSRYAYLYQCIKEDIISGKIKKGEKLPSKRALANHLNLGVITVANAYAQLLTEGYIEAKEKRGYYVLDLSHYKPQKPYASETKTEEELLLSESSYEADFFADFKANRTGIRHFPATRWSYYMREALSLQDDSMLKTVPYNGLFKLRLAISRYLLSERGMSVSPSQIIIGAGTEYLYGRLIQLFGRACTFASEEPGYQKFSAISGSYGNPWIYVPIDNKGLRVDLLEEYGADVVHVSPANHFPTGIVMPVTRRAELFEWVNRVKKRYIIEDDYDSEFRYSGQLILPLYTEDTNKKVIYMNTFSKTLVPSLRISYMILPSALIERYEKTLSFYSCTVSSFEQYALARFIEEGELERHISRMRNYYKKQRKLILDEIHNSPLSEVSRIHENNAGTHFLLEINTDLSESEVRRLGYKNNLMLSLYSDYSSSTDKMFEAYYESSCILVINYAGIDPEKVPEMIRRLCNIFISDNTRIIIL